MNTYRFPGFAVFLKDAAARIGHPEAERSARTIPPLAALANLCAQANVARPADVAGILAKAEEFRDQLHAAHVAADLMLADVHKALDPPVDPPLQKRVSRAVRASETKEPKPKDDGSTTKP